MGKGILIIVFAAMLGGGAMLFNSQQMARDVDQELSEGHESQILARELARSGMNRAVGKVHRDWDEAVNEINSQMGAVDEDGGNYTVDAKQVSSTAVDLDVVGTFGSQNYHMEKSLVKVGGLDAPFVIDAPNADPVFIGSDFRVDGKDRRPPSSDEGGPSVQFDKPGLKTKLPRVRDQYAASLLGRLGLVHGVIDNEGTLGGSSLKALNAHEDWEVSLDELYEEAINHPQVIVSKATTIDGGMLGKTIGSENSPAIYHVPSSVMIKGKVTGYGLLIVDGGLYIDGAFTWEGVVMVRDDNSNVRLTYNGDSNIYGSLVVMQRGEKDWAFEMPTDGELKVTYKSSSAGFGSEVWVKPWGEEADLLFKRGSNRTGDQLSVYDRVFRRGERINFFINVEGCLLSFVCTIKNYWDHYAVGHTSSSGKPYAEVTQLGDYKWEIAFEDLPGDHPSTDWDYNDQVILVEILPAEGDDEDPWWTGDDGGTDGGKKVLVCHKDDTKEVNVSALMGHLGHGDTQGPCDEDNDLPSQGWTAQTTFAGNASVYYSGEAIARLGSKLKVIREATRVVVVDQWEDMANASYEEGGDDEEECGSSGKGKSCKEKSKKDKEKSKKDKEKGK